MGHKTRRVLGSKWKKTAVLMRNKELRPFIPETKRWTFTTLRKMMRKHKMVYVKPVRGSFGQGVIQAKVKKRHGTKVYKYHHRKQKLSFTSFRSFYTSLNPRRRNKAYLVQKGIKLLKWKNRPFDIRVMVQRTKNKPWKATGIIGRVAHPQKIVTNFHSEGKPMPAEKLFKPYLTKSQRMNYKRILKRLSVNIAEHLNKKYSGFREIGVDLGIDNMFHPWILEVNTLPDPYIFNQLKNKSTFRTVLSYSRENGRFKKKK